MRHSRGRVLLRVPLLLSVVIALSFALAFLSGCRSPLALGVRTPEALAAMGYLEDMGWKVVAYEGRASDYVLTKDLLLGTTRTRSVWMNAIADPVPYLGKTIIEEHFVVKGHPLDHWTNHSLVSPETAQGRTDVWVLVVDGRPIGGTSFPVVTQRYVGGPYPLDARDHREVFGYDSYVEWAREWREGVEAAGALPGSDGATPTSAGG